jgi:hypothetical protein
MGEGRERTLGTKTMPIEMGKSDTKCRSFFEMAGPGQWEVDPGEFLNSKGIGTYEWGWLL